MDKSDKPSNVPAEPVYSYRPSLLGAAWEFRLGPTALIWQAGSRSGHIAYTDIKKVALAFRPATMQNHRFIVQIWSRSAPKLTVVSTSVKSMLEQSRQDSGYSGFVTELHRRIAASGSGAVFIGGTHPLRFWPGLIVFAAASLGLAALAVRALQVDTLAAAVFIAAFLALFLWQIGGFLRRNRPRSYRPDALPPELLPR